MFDLINKFGFSEFVIDKTYYANFFLWYAPLLIIQAVLGVTIYKHFCTASVYYFTRVNNRIRWWLKECMHLYVKVLLCIVSIIMLSNFWEFISGEYIIDAEGVWLLLYYIAIFSLWEFSAVCTINILSIIIGSYYAYAFMALTQIILVMAFLPIGDKIFNNNILLKVNPISHLILYWHSSIVPTLNEKINLKGTSFDLNESIIYMTILSAIIIFFGAIVIKEKEFICLDKEGGNN